MKIEITQIMDWIVYAAYTLKWPIKYKIFPLLFVLLFFCDFPPFLAKKKVFHHVCNMPKLVYQNICNIYKCKGFLTLK